MTDYQQKYLKYKNKYIELKNELNGGNPLIQISRSNIHRHAIIMARQREKEREREIQRKREKERQTEIRKNNINELCKTNNDNCDDANILLYYEKLYNYNNDLEAYNNHLKAYNNLIDTYRNEYQNKLDYYNLVNDKDKKYQEEYHNHLNEYTKKYKELKDIYDTQVLKHIITGKLFVEKTYDKLVKFDTYKDYLNDIRKKLLNDPNDPNDKDMEEYIIVKAIYDNKNKKPLTLEEYTNTLKKPVEPVKPVKSI